MQKKEMWDRDETWGPSCVKAYGLKVQNDYGDINAMHHESFGH